MSESSAEIVLQAAGVHRSFRMGRETIEVLRDLEVMLRRGERVSVVGASGSGKTTMINVLGLLDRPQAGSVHVLGRDALAVGARQRNRLRNGGIGFIFQFYHLVNELTALENVLLPAMIGISTFAWPSRRTAQHERANSLLEQVGLADRRKHRPQELSGGERQRVAIARALMNDPAVLFCDEPTGNLDPRTSGGVQELLLEIGNRGRAMLLVTHDSKFAGRCDRVLRLREGRLVPAEASAVAADAPQAAGGTA